MLVTVVTFFHTCYSKTFLGVSCTKSKTIFMICIFKLANVHYNKVLNHFPILF